jgi:hypothetical protein
LEELNMRRMRRSDRSRNVDLRPFHEARDAA